MNAHNLTLASQQIARSSFENAAIKNSGAIVAKGSLGVFEPARQFGIANAICKALVNVHKWHDISAAPNTTMLARVTTIKPALKLVALTLGLGVIKNKQNPVSFLLGAFKSFNGQSLATKFTSNYMAQQFRASANIEAPHLKAIEKAAEETIPKLNNPQHSISQEKPIVSLLNFRNALKKEMPEEYDQDTSPKTADEELQRTDKESKELWKPLLISSRSIVKLGRYLKDDNAELPPMEKPAVSEKPVPTTVVKVIKTESLESKSEAQAKHSVAKQHSVAKKDIPSESTLTRRHSDSELVNNTPRPDILKRHKSMNDAETKEFDINDFANFIDKSFRGASQFNSVSNYSRQSTGKQPTARQSTTIESPFNDDSKNSQTADHSRTGSFSSRVARRLTGRRNTISGIGKKVKVDSVSSGSSVRSAKSTGSSIKSFSNHLKNVAQMIKNSDWYQNIEAAMTRMFKNNKGN